MRISELLFHHNISFMQIFMKQYKLKFYTIIFLITVLKYNNGLTFLSHIVEKLIYQ